MHHPLRNYLKRIIQQSFIGRANIKLIRSFIHPRSNYPPQDLELILGSEMTETNNSQTTWFNLFA